MAATMLARDTGTNYYTSTYSKGDVKFRQRALVLRFMTRYFVPNFKMSVLTLPGEDWLFEQMMLQQFPFCSFIGLEKSTAVFRKARLQIPRNALAYEFERDAVQDRDLTFGRSSIHYSRISNGFKTKGEHTSAITKANRRCNRLVLMDVHDFLRMLVEDHDATYEEKKKFVYRFYHKHAVWLDFTGPLTERVLNTVSNINLCLYPSIRLKPIVITVLNGRDTFKSKVDRIAAIQAALPGLTIKHAWTYRGAGGCSMLTVCGEMT